MSGLKGDRIVLQNLNKEIQKLRVVTMRGLTKAGYLVISESKKNTPVDTGHLVNSTYLNQRHDLVKPAVEIGYTASYAPMVHESDKNYRGPQRRGWKFLERALNTTKGKIIRLLTREAKIK